MKVIEEKSFKDLITIIDRYLIKSNNIISFYNCCNDFKIKSLQKVVNENNNKFFDDVSFVLDAIMAIIKKPYIANKAEEVILRSDVVGNMSNESLQVNYKDPTIWKEKDLEMSPEYVHHYQYVDDIKTYENIFIGMLINIIDKEMNSFLNLYESLISSIDESIELEDNKTNDNSINKINKIEKKLRYIKETYFYKEVSKKEIKDKIIERTNILTKNRLYNYCYKFYKKIIQYNDYNLILEYLKKYYLVLILRNIKIKNYTIDNNTNDLNDLYFYVDDFKININSKEDYIKYIVEYKGIKSVTNIYIDVVDQEKNYNYNGDNNILLKLYNIYYFDNNSYIFNNSKSEEELIDYIVSNSVKTYNAKKKLYITYCPVCKSKNLNKEKNLYICNLCKSEYTFKGNKIWFKKIRRI